MKLNPHVAPMTIEPYGFGGNRVVLPLNILVAIISYGGCKIISHECALTRWIEQLDDSADLAHACLTCRVLLYMCLPKLYTNVVLRSYDHIRYSEETLAPEGIGGASPFIMGLKALLTRDVVQRVENLTLTGKLRMDGAEESAQVGRVPDNGMMLALLTRACLDRTSELREFSWTLHTKMLPIVWEALAERKNLQKLTVRMPSTRYPTPITAAPVLPNLTHLHIENIDPTCYPDNFSELLYHSRKLQHLRLHFNSRMRNEREPSLNMDSFFGRVKTSNYRMQLKSFALQNFYAASGGNFTEVHDTSVVEDLTLIDSSFGADSDASMSFSNHIPLRAPQFGQVKRMRGNTASVQHAKSLPALLKTVQAYYLITGRPVKEAPWPNVESSTIYQDTPESMGSRDTPSSSGKTSSSNNTTSSSRSEAAMAQLQPVYIDALFAEPRPQFRSLLTFPQWKWTTSNLTQLARNMPHIEELGLATEPPPFDVIAYLAPHLSKLAVLRLLNSPAHPEVANGIEAVAEWYEVRIGAAAWNRKNTTLRWVGIGDLFFEVIRGWDRQVEIDGTKQTVRSVRRVPHSRVAALPVWAKDVLQI